MSEEFLMQYVARVQWEDGKLFTFEQKVLILKDSFLVHFHFCHMNIFKPMYLAPFLRTMQSLNETSTGFPGNPLEPSVERSL
jgi:hypothetical protein